ncbi:MAG: NEW3 domain-containing protein [Armatimonadota bacterium]|nr:NEW3 domain-containing protein [Armatimonadota bacterium]MDR7455456.1 NEW3 domain-containing protein [Armatimonadota bacterium]MDR7457742.1 NEW3 domain-containing protein [Armatimonadota bacterium]MDR7497525.1 NEW3 domain-containing protein [Armatimonadota bacterium]MDR7512489.1 NEW3 domain-containing protein [Armatimonadota bacterium]
MPQFVVRLLVVSTVAALVLAGPAAAAPAPESSPAYRGLGLSTPYPSQTVRQGEPVTLTLTVRNYGLPPQVVNLAVAETSPGWRVTFQGGGRPISAVAVGTDQEATLSARFDPPAAARRGTFRFVLTARGQDGQATLPVALTFGQVAPSRLTLTAELPVLRGPGSSSFRYRLTLKNDGDQDLLVSLDAQTPRGFQVTFTPAFGSQQVTSLPVKAGESREIDTEISLPQDVAAGTYEVTVRAGAGEARADTKLTLEVTGRPDLSITTPEGRLSGRAYVGQETAIKILVRNRGTAPARNVEVSAFEPSGWTVRFEPARIAEIAARTGEQEVTAFVRPSQKAIAGDYVLTLRASAGDVSTSADYRVTVFTTALWGIVGIGVIAVAVVVLGLVVSRYGRR